MNTDHVAHRDNTFQVPKQDVWTFSCIHSETIFSFMIIDWKCGRPTETLKGGSLSLR